jgi:hypothetical protein
LSKQCTHLLCASTAGKKYEAALKWHIQCVGIEWLHQSIERGMSLDSKYFTLDIEPAQRGEGAWDRNSALKALNQSGLVDPSLDKEVPIDFDSGARRRRLRRAGSKVAQEGLWEGILGGVIEAQNVPHPLSQPTSAHDAIGQPPPTEEPAMGDYKLDFGGPPLGLFDGLTFYILGFTEKKVSQPRSILISREKFWPMSYPKMVALCLRNSAWGQRMGCTSLTLWSHTPVHEKKFRLIAVKLRSSPKCGLSAVWLPTQLSTQKS